MFFIVPFSSFAQTNTSEYYDSNSGNVSSTAQEPIPPKEDTQKIVNEGEAGAANENQLIKNEFDLSATPQEDGAESMKDNTEDALSVANVASKNDLRAFVSTPGTGMWAKNLYKAKMTSVKISFFLRSGIRIALSR